MSRTLWLRKLGKVKKPGPEYNKEGIPYDYIIIVDSGSKGSRLFVYNWLNPEALLKLGSTSKDNKPRLVKKFTLDDDLDYKSTENSKSFGYENLERDDHLTSKKGELDQNSPFERKIKTDQHVDAPILEEVESSESDSINLEDFSKNLDESANEQSEVSTKKPASNESEHSENSNLKPTTESSSAPSQSSSGEQSLPKVGSKKSWHAKIRPGISSFNSSPQKLGNHHLVYLLQLASSVVPKSQHYRTPFFLHSTAGMRLLAPNEQSIVLETICDYVKSNSEFYLPDCSSHINVIDGDVEGLYGWLSVNYMVGSLDHPGSHQHGKNHHTYGLLDMGGASTQVVFMPNSTEIEEHQNNLFDITLYRTATKASDTKHQDNESNSNPTLGVFEKPQTAEYMVYADSFLGFGMYQAHRKYLNLLIKESPDVSSGSYFLAPLNDPCLPKGYRNKGYNLDLSSDFTGESDFQKCLTSIFPVILNTTYNSMGQAPNANCNQLTDDMQVSTCLLNDLIPAFDFEVNHFFGVSGYWDSITNLLAIQPEDKSEESNYGERDLEGVGNYDYKVIYNKTSKICSKSFKELMQLNQLRPLKDRLSEEELSELCFKSSWILNFLHLGLGFPRLGIDSVDDSKASTYKSLQLLDEIKGSQFTWTLGRAILYANDEYAQAFNNYSKSINSDAAPLKRAGYFHTFSKNDFHYGAEQQSIPLRPQFQKNRDPLTFHYYSYENRPSDYEGELKWYIQPHRWYGLMIFVVLLSFVAFLLLGKSGRTRIFQSISARLQNWGLFFRKRTPYQSIPVRDIEGGVELDDLEENPNKNTDESMGDSIFQLEDETQDIDHL